MSVAAPNGLDYDGLVRRSGRIRIATKFMKWARDYFAQQGVHVDLIKLYGSMELSADPWDWPTRLLTSWLQAPP